MKTLLYLAILAGIFVSCKRDKTEWDTDLKAPIIQTQLNLSNLVTSNNIQTDGDSTLKLVFENEVVNVAISDVFVIDVTEVEFGSSLQTLKLADDSVSQSISLGQIAKNLGLIGNILIAQNGNSMAIPALTGLSAPATTIDNSALIESLTIESGQLEISITNGLPIDITNLTIELRNGPSYGGAVVGSTTFPLIAKGTTATNVEILDGKTIYGELVAEIKSFSSPGSGGSPVLIDTTDAVEALVKFKSVVPLSATAIWPNQNLVDTTRTYTIPSTNGLMIKEMTVKEGIIDFEVFSSLQDTIYITYTVPNLRRNNQSYTITTKVPPAPPAGTSSINESYSFSNYDFKLNGYGIEAEYGQDLNGNAMNDPDTVNTYVQNFQVKIQYTGQKKTLSKNDTVYIKATVHDIEPSYASGYLGKDTIPIGPASQLFDVFNNYVSGKVSFKDVKMDLSFENGIGADGKMEIIQLSGTNSKTSNTVNLTGAAVSAPFNISQAVETFNPNFPVNLSTSVLALNGSNSNAPAFISNLPSNLNYEIRTILNPDLPVPTVSQVINNPPNFIYDGYGLAAKMNLEIPLSLVADSLILCDTLDFVYTGSDGKITDADFTLAVENGFGFDATVHLLILDANMNVIDTLISKGRISRASVDPSTGKVLETNKSLIHFSVNAVKINYLKNSTKIKAVIELHTFNLNDSNKAYHKIRSSDQFKIKLIGRTLYNIKF